VTANLGRFVAFEQIETLRTDTKALLVSCVVHVSAFRVWVCLGKGVATNALPRGDTLPHFFSRERVNPLSCLDLKHGENFQ